MMNFKHSGDGQIRIPELDDALIAIIHHAGGKVDAEGQRKAAGLMAQSPAMYDLLKFLLTDIEWQVDSPVKKRVKRVLRECKQ